ncbi:phage protein [Neisseria gonorrhoeae MS11]|nr:phage protein [Neisseria gonorrhoeae MS11]AGU85163.1 phage protein [Neisseria gonorrhoeae MS11]
MGRGRIPADFRHSRESGNPETPNAAGIYRKRLKPDGPDSRLRGNDGSVATVTVRFRSCWNFGKLMNRHSRRFPSFPRKRESGNPERGRNLSETAETGRTGFPLSREWRRSGWRVKCLRPPFQAASGFQGAGPAPLQAAFFPTNLRHRRPPTQNCLRRRGCNKRRR